MIEVKILADSLAENGSRLTTYLVTYPRFAHAEVMTHRVFSRNASSSRAIPVARQIEMVVENPAVPIAFTRNKAGMQGGEALTGDEHELAVQTWLKGRDAAVAVATELANSKVHKQYANRPLEPYAHITVVISATDYDNFFALRCHPDALPEMQELAKKMYQARVANKPTLLAVGQWHLPFINQETWDQIAHECFPDRHTEVAIKVSVAKCARTSYLNHNGTKTTIAEELELYDRLIARSPLHASPAEHQATPIHVGAEWNKSGNFTGFYQWRKNLPGENVTSFVPQEES